MAALREVLAGQKQQDQSHSQDNHIPQDANITVAHVLATSNKVTLVSCRVSISLVSALHREKKGEEEEEARIRRKKNRLIGKTFLV